MFLYRYTERGGVLHIYISIKYKHKFTTAFPSKGADLERRIQPQAQLPPV